MRQRFQLDRLPRGLYFGVSMAGVGLAAACYRAPQRVVPMNVAVVPAGAAAATEAQIAGWVGATVPSGSRLHKFTWLFQKEQGSLGGNGAARIAPPDSLRFDAREFYGVKTWSAAVVGTRPLWAEPADAVDELVPDYTLFWAMFGVARLPAAGAALHGLADGAMVAWRYAEQADTVEYRYTRGSPSSLLAEVRRAGVAVGRVQATFDSGGVLRNATLIVPSAPARLDLTFQSTTRTTFEPTVWSRRDP